MRHHRGADDADGDVQHLRIGDDLGRGDEAAGDLGDRRLRQDQFDQEAAGDDQHQADDKGLEMPEAAVLQVQHHHDVERGQHHAPQQRDAEQQLQRDRGTDHLGQVAGDDRHLAQQPQGHGDRLRIMVAAGLGQVASGDDAQLGRQRLQQDRHHIRQQDDRQQRVAEGRAAGQVGRPVAGVHVADGNEIAGADKGEQLAQPADADRYCDAAVHLGQARSARRRAPARAGGAALLGDLLARDIASHHACSFLSAVAQRAKVVCRFDLPVLYNVATATLLASVITLSFFDLPV